MLWLFLKNFAIWAVVGFVSIVVVYGTNVGELIYTIPVGRGYGVYAFDLVVFPIGILAATFTVLDYILFRIKEEELTDPVDTTLLQSENA